MSTKAPSARELARRLVGRAAAQGNEPHSAALAAHAACERTYRELTRSLGQSGAHALLTRALAQARTEHPLMGDIRIGAQSEPGLVGVPGIVEAHGAPAVAAALEAVLETLLGLLGRLIGDDMMAQLVEHITPIETKVDEDVK